MADVVALLKLEEKLPSYAVMLFRYYHYIILEYVVVRSIIFSKNKFVLSLIPPAPMAGLPT